MPLQIRNETTRDIAAIEALIIVAFDGAPHADGDEHRIVNALRISGQLAVSLVADDDGRIIGHAAVSLVRISGGDRGEIPGWYGLGPVSVAPERQRRGIGSRLVEEALDWLRKRGAAGCVVLGDPDYYGRFGFKAVAGLMLPGFPPEYFQALPFGGDPPAGMVSFHESFGAVDA